MHERGAQERSCRVSGGNTWDNLDSQAFSWLPPAHGQHLKHHAGHAIDANVTAGDERYYFSGSGQIDRLLGPVHFFGEFAAKGLLVQRPWTQQGQITTVANDHFTPIQRLFRLERSLCSAPRS